MSEHVTGQGQGDRPDAPWTDLAPFKSGQHLRHLADSQLANPSRSNNHHHGLSLRDALSRITDSEIFDRLQRRGDGEDGVSSRLSKHEVDGWHYLNSVPLGTAGGSVDHVAIGPGGVFTLNSKNHVGKRVRVNLQGVWVDGRPTPYLSDALDDADEAGRLLSTAAGFPVFVTGVIVVQAHDVKHQGRPEGVTVVSRRQFTTWLRALPPRLTDDDVAILYDVARRSTTWHR